MGSVWSRLLGTMQSSFRVGKGTFDASGLTAARTFALPDAGGTLALAGGGGGAVDVSTQQFRLSVVSGADVPTTDQVGAGTLYLTPSSGTQIALYDGTSTWAARTTAEISLALAGLTSGTNYDVFAYYTGSAVALELTAWTDAVTRATALVRQDGVYVRSGAATRRYVGTIRATGAATTEDSAANRLVWNASNRVTRPLKRRETASTWTYASTAVRQANANAANQVTFVRGLAADMVTLTATSFMSNASPPASSSTGVMIGLDSSTTPAADAHRGLSYIDANASGANRALTTAYYAGNPAAGYHALTWLESGDGFDTTTFVGTTWGGLLGAVMG